MRDAWELFWSGIWLAMSGFAVAVVLALFVGFLMNFARSLAGHRAGFVVGALAMLTAVGAYLAFAAWRVVPAM